jgi:2-methylaconitate cis-trans-isomerase PrpF
MNIPVITAGQLATQSARRGRIRAVIMRGGTSRGLFFHDRDLPRDPAERDAVLLRCMGSPDPYRSQIDGLGGATSSTSKIVIIKQSDRNDCDVDYLFGQVSIDKPLVDYSTSCGNLLSAVGPFAIEEGLVPAHDGEVTVRIWQANLGERIDARVQVCGGVPVETGDFRIDGVPFGSAEICLDFLEIGKGRPVLPTGQTIDSLMLPDGTTVDATLVDAAAPTVFVRAADFGLSGSELPAAVNANASVLARLESVRAAAAVKLGLAPDHASATRDRPASPKIAFVGKAQDYQTTSGDRVAANSIDVVSRMISMERCHHAFPVTGVIAITVAAATSGTIVADLRRESDTTEEGALRLGHAAGVGKAAAIVVRSGATCQVTRATIIRSARRLMDGSLYVPT